MIPLEPNVSMVDPLQRSGVHCRPFRALTWRLVLAEAAAKAYGAIVTSEATGASGIRRATTVRSSSHIVSTHQGSSIAGVDDEALPDVTTNNVMNSIDVLIVFGIVEHNRICIVP